MSKFTSLMSAAAVAAAGGFAALPAPAAAQDAHRTSPRSSSTATTRALARPTTRSSSAPAVRKPSATGFRRRCARAARRSRCESWAVARKHLETVGSDRHQQLLAGRTGRLHRLPRPRSSRRPRASASSRRTSRRRRSKRFVERDYRAPAASVTQRSGMAGRARLSTAQALASAEQPRSGALLRPSARAWPTSPSPRRGSAFPTTA